MRQDFASSSPKSCRGNMHLPQPISALRSRPAIFRACKTLFACSAGSMASSGSTRRPWPAPPNCRSASVSSVCRASVIAKTKSKLAQRRAWARDRALCVSFTTVEALEDMDPAIDAVGGFPVIVKPDRSLGGSRGVSLVANAADNATAFAFARAHSLPGSAIVVESALSGPQYSAELMVRDGRTRVLAIGRKVKSAAPYCVDLAIVYPGVTDEAAIGAIEDMCARATSLLGITRGPGHIEFALTRGWPKTDRTGCAVWRQPHRGFCRPRQRLPSHGGSGASGLRHADR